MKIIEIKSGWFKAAGNVYHWRPTHHVFGVGIDMNILKTEPSVGIMIDGDVYGIQSKKALEFISNYKSIKVAGKKKLGIVSKSILMTIKKKPMPDISPAKGETAPQNGKLF